MNLLDLVGQHEWCLFGCHRVSRMVAHGATILDGQMPMFPNQVGASELIEHSTEAFVQSTPQALRELRTGNRPFFGQKTGPMHGLRPSLRQSPAAPVPALVFPMPFAGFRQACRFVFVAERYPPSRRKMTPRRSFLSH